MRCDVCGVDVRTGGRSGPRPGELRCHTCPDEHPQGELFPEAS